SRAAETTATPARPASPGCSPPETCRITSTARPSPAPAAAASRRSTPRSSSKDCTSVPPGSAAMRKRPSKGLAEEEVALFREAVRDTTPIRPVARVRPEGKSPPPVPVQALLDGHEAVAESLDGDFSEEHSPETGEEPSYLRSGLGTDVLRKLRR